MKKIHKWLTEWRESDYGVKTLISSTVSAVIGLAFTLYNGFLGIYYSSVWNGAICVYYILLAAIRGIVVNGQIKAQSGIYHGKRYIRRIYLLTHIILLAINIALIVPIAVMIKGNRTVSFGMIPAITVAAYTTYRVTMAVINFKKSRKSKTPLFGSLEI